MGSGGDGSAGLVQRRADGVKGSAFDYLVFLLLRDLPELRGTVLVCLYTRTPRQAADTNRSSTPSRRPHELGGLRASHSDSVEPRANASECVAVLETK